MRLVQPHSHTSTRKHPRAFTNTHKHPHALTNTHTHPHALPLSLSTPILLSVSQKPHWMNCKGQQARPFLVVFVTMLQHLSKFMFYFFMPRGFISLKCRFVVTDWVFVCIENGDCDWFEREFVSPCLQIENSKLVYLSATAGAREMGYIQTSSRRN